MKFLLDTHIFLWYVTGDQRLPPDARAAIKATTNDVFLSVISVWEMLIKYQLGRLVFPGHADIYLRELAARHAISLLSLDVDAVTRLLLLPPVHRDPFDRMLICQAIRYEMTFVTVDDEIMRYEVDGLRLWRVP
jgi:PIN domain nuclease of toxin-antitoxin system